MQQTSRGVNINLVIKEIDVMPIVHYPEVVFKELQIQIVVTDHLRLLIAGPS